MTLRSALVSSLVALPLGVPGCYVAAQPSAAGTPVVVGQRLQLRSQSMGDVRPYFVHRPANYDISNARYPVLVVLDGESLFQHASATVDLLAAAGKIPPMLVVGIPNVDRFRDLDSTAAPGTSPFLKFVRDELLPTIDRDYRTQPYRVLAGHSYAGLFALYSLIDAPEAFRGYVVMAAAFGDNPELPKKIAAFLEEHKDRKLNAAIFMATDNGTGTNLTGAWELSSHLQNRAARLLDLRFTLRTTNESHAAVPLRSLDEGLRFIFDGWDVDDPFKLYEQGGLTAIDKHYAELAAWLGFPVPVPDEVLFGAFGQLARFKRFPEAEQVINKALGASPDSLSGLYYAARLYAQMGNRPLMIERLKRGLLLSPNDPALRSLVEDMKLDPKDFASPVHLTAKDLAKFVGGYGASAVVFEVEQRGDGLLGKTADQAYELNAVSATAFACSDCRVTASFQIDARGKVTGLEFGNGGAKLAKLR